MLRRLALCLVMPIVGLPFAIQPAQAADGPVPLVTQIADEPVSVSAAEFRRHLFVAADAARLSDPSNTADLLAERVLQHMYAVQPRTDADDAAAAVQQLRAAAAGVTGPAFDSRIAATMVAFQQAALADTGPVAATVQRATTEVVTLTAQQISAVAAGTHAENALGTSGDTESRLLASPTFTPTAVLLDSVTLADANPSFASARDLLWKAATGASISATSAVLLTDAPRLRDNANVQALAGLRDQAGNLNTTGGAIAGTPTDPAPNTIGRVVQQLDAALDTTREAAQASTGADPVDAAVPAQAVEDARDAQTTLALQTGFLTGGTSGAKDIVDQVGAIAVQVTLLAMSYNDYSAGTIGRAALSGNVLGVVMTLLPGVLDAAGVFGPSAEDLMMTQLDNISEQMADFQNAVNGQFAVVFENLSRVSAQLDDITQKLDRAVIDIEQARVQVGQMYDSLARLQGSLDAVQNNILEALRNGTNSQLRQVIDSALGYADRNHSPLPLNDFNNAAAFLHTFATVTARHSPELNTDYPSFDVQNDANQLSTGIASNVHFLDRAPVERGWQDTRLSGTTGDAPQLASMDDFVLASRAYAQLMLENPAYVSAGYRRWLSDIQQLGTPLAALTSAISTSDSPDFTHSTLLNHVICARTSAAFAPAPNLTPCQAPNEDTPPVDTMVQKAATQLMSTVPGYDGATPTPSSPLTVDGATTFDPFVDTSTAPSDLSGLWPNLTPRKTVAQCSPAPGEPAATLGAMERPPSLTPDSQGVPQVFQWADRMGLGTLNVCYKDAVRSYTIQACQFDDQWTVVGILDATKCAKTFWRRSSVSSETGSPTTVTYQNDDIAFVWTYTPADSPNAPMYVQSLVRRGAATAPKSTATEFYLPRGGYVKNPTLPTYIGAADIEPSGSKFELTNVQAASLYAPLSTATGVRDAWGDATTSTVTNEDYPPIYSYQDRVGVPQDVPIWPGYVLDQPIAGLDPKLGLGSASYARTCTAAEQASSSSLCQSGAGGVSILSLDAARESVGDAANAELVTLQGDIYRGLLRGTQTAGSTTSGPLHDALVRLDGANALLGGYLQLGAGAALRQRDLTSLPGELTGSKALTDAIKAEVAKTVAGTPAKAPGLLVTDTLDFHIPDLEGLDGLLPDPGAGVGNRLAAGASVTPVPGPVNPALQSTNDQLALTAIALGAPASVAPPTTTPPPTSTPTTTSTSTSTSTPTVAHLTFASAWVPVARVGEHYKAHVTATGGTATYSWSRHGRLPRGLKGAPTSSGRSYLVRGRPTQKGVFVFSLTAMDANGATTTKRYTIRVR